MENLNLDIHSFLQTAALLALVGFVVLFLRGLKLIRDSAELPYFRMRREQLVNGWRVLGISILMGLGAVLVNVFGEPIVYRYYPITATVTLTQTLTVTPIITLSPTITLTPSLTPTLEFTYTPTITSTPHVPLAISGNFESEVTPGANVVFSPLTFSKGYDDDFFPIQPGTVFQNPAGHIYALFSYDGMLVGSQWTALWYREGILVHYESQAWDGNTGGFGFSDWEPEPFEWEAGNYEVQIFVGLQWVTTGVFIIEGQPPTSTATIETPSTPTPTLTMTATISSTATSTATPTPEE